MTDAPTFMRREIGEIPEAVATLIARSGDTLAAAGRRLADKNPALVATVARGSSDHAATYLKYAIELSAGLPVASLGPSVASVYGRQLKLQNAACFAVSQSGQSPDIVAMAQAARAGGALTFALTNTPASPLAAACEEVVDIMAGAERSVAATKTFVNSVAAGLLVLAGWVEDDALLDALKSLPEKLENALACDWSALAEALDDAPSLFILGRGLSLSVAAEAALKFKETSAIHAEAYSTAEVMHGPVSIVGEDFPVLALAARDAAEPAIVKTADQLGGKGAEVFATSDRVARAHALPTIRTGHPITDPLALIVSFYVFIEALARRRGLDPDRPANLRKVTETK